MHSLQLIRTVKMPLRNVIKLTWPLLSKSRSPLFVPISRLTPHNEAQFISELNRFLYFLISGIWSDVGSRGCTFIFPFWGGGG